MEKLEKHLYVQKKKIGAISSCFFVVSEKERIAASEGLSCDAQKNIRKINQIYFNCKYLPSESKLYHSKV